MIIHKMIRTALSLLSKIVFGVLAFSVGGVGLVCALAGLIYIMFVSSVTVLSGGIFGVFWLTAAFCSGSEGFIAHFICPVALLSVGYVLYRIGYCFSQRSFANLRFEDDFAIFDDDD